MKTRAVDEAVCRIERWLDQGSLMPSKKELPNMASAIEYLLSAYLELRQRSETLSIVLVEAAARGFSVAPFDESANVEKGGE